MIFHRSRNYMRLYGIEQRSMNDRSTISNLLSITPLASISLDRVPLDENLVSVELLGNAILQRISFPKNRNFRIFPACITNLQ